MTGKFAIGLVTGILALGIPMAPHIAREMTSSDGDHLAAQKTTIAGSSLEIMSVPLTAGSSSEVHTLLSTNTRTATTEDLAMQVTLECALWTDVSVTGNGESQAVAQVKVWVEFDGQPIAVSSDEPAGTDHGQVTFCNRDYKFKVTNAQDENAMYEQHLATKSANGFNWILINAGNGVHSIVVKCQLDATVSGTGTAYATVGKRTLISEPVHLANDATVSA